MKDTNVKSSYAKCGDACLMEPHPLMSSVESWARAYILTTSLSHKLSPPPRPVPKIGHQKNVSYKQIEKDEQNLPIIPGRPENWIRVTKVKKIRSHLTLESAAKRTELLHRFFHHELQAAELMAWAFLAFPDAPLAFRMGLLRILDDEIRHMNMYYAHINHLGFELTRFPYRDWFWERVPKVLTAAHYCATMGIGFEGGNLDHLTRFIKKFREAKDEKGAQIQEQIHDDEITHVQFAFYWFQRFTDMDAAHHFDVWRSYLPFPLSPVLMKGNILDEDARINSGFGASFIEKLKTWTLQDR